MKYSEEEVKEVRQALRSICGGKAYDWLDMLGGSKQDAHDLRRMILLDYQYNTHDIKGIDELSIVLKYIAHSITE